jgi:hypothetical protein
LVTFKGKYKKESIYTLLPYFAERGAIKFIPPGVTGASSLKVRGASNGMMTVMNMKDYAGKKIVMFDGNYIEKENRKPKRMSPSTLITVNTKDMKYDCTPSVQ